MDELDIRGELLAAFGEAVQNDGEINGADAVDVITDLVSRIQAVPAAGYTRGFSINALSQAEELCRRVLKGQDPMGVARALLADLEGLRRDAATAAEAIQAAREACDDDLGIDDSPIVARAGGGTWVNAWIWIQD